MASDEGAATRVVMRTGRARALSQSLAASAQLMRATVQPGLFAYDMTSEEQHPSLRQQSTSATAFAAIGSSRGTARPQRGSFERFRTKTDAPAQRLVPH